MGMLCQESYHLVQSNGAIKCPVPDCAAASWTSHDVQLVLPARAFIAYREVLISLLKPPEHEHGKTDVTKVIEALNLRCPNSDCSWELDPSPDGCAAMQCFRCGTQFCWCCFAYQGFNSSADIHKHVLTCPENPKQGDYFPPRDVVEKVVHRKRKILMIRDVLQEIANGDAAWRENARCIDAINASLHVLTDSGIIKDDILSV